MKKYSVVIVDDHLLIAKAITSIVDAFPDFEVLYEAGNGQILRQRILQSSQVPDIVLLDIMMPVMDGFATTAWLKEAYPGILVMALSVQDDDESLIKMIKAGAKGYLHKNVHPAELEKALHALLRNGMYYPEWATSKVFMRMAGEERKGADELVLTAREKEFLQYSCTELTYKEIGGKKCFASPRTVESYRDSLFEKLGVKTRVALALYAVKSGLYKL